MWDEKKFFSEYKEEQDQIKPDPEFVNQLNDLVNKESTKGKVKKFPTKYIALAASLLLCAGVGAYTYQMNKTVGSQEIENVDFTLSAASATDEPDYADTTAEAGSESDEKALVNAAETKLNKILEYLKQGADIYVDGDLATGAQQENLLSLIEKAHSVDEISLMGNDYVVYEITGESTEKLYVYGNQYIKVEGTDFVYQVESNNE